VPYPLLPPAVGGTGEPVDVVTAGVDLELELGFSAGAPRARPETWPAEDPAWIVRVVDRSGNVLEELEHANVGPVVRTLNGEDEFSFSSPKYDPATLAVELAGEAQVLRKGVVMAWGPVVGDDASSADPKVSFTGRGPWWYFRKRFFGTADRRNFLTNGDFETGAASGVLNASIPGWTRVGGARSRHWTTATKPGGHGLPAPLSGTKAVSLDSGIAGQNAYLRSRFSYRTSFPPGQRITVAAWYWIGDGWIGPAALGLGLYVGRRVGGEFTVQNAAAVDNDSPRGEWVRLETSIIVPPNEDGEVEVRLYQPAGWIVWDAAVSVLMESTGAGFTPTDQTELAATVVRYAQTGRGKSSLNVGTDTPPTGVLRRRAWQHADHQWIADAVTELGTLPDGFDFSVDVDERSRTFRTHYPRKGVDRSDDVVLRLGRPEDGGNLSSYRRGREVGSSATSVVTRAQGDGPDREEGGAIDPAALDGLVLEDLVDAPSNLTIGDLDDFAADELEVRKRPAVVLEVTTYGGAGALIELLDVGDLVRVVIDDGYVQVDAVFRIVRLSIDPKTETMVLTLNTETT
jgi:hypothetical protein